LGRRRGRCRSAGSGAEGAFVTERALAEFMGANILAEVNRQPRGGIPDFWVFFLNRNLNLALNPNAGGR
jgi:hypothetical protein